MTLSNNAATHPMNATICWRCCLIWWMMKPGEALTDLELRDETATVFAAGYETTSVAMTWALYQLSQNPDIADKLTQSVDGLSGNLPAFEDFRELGYARPGHGRNHATVSASIFYPASGK